MQRVTITLDDELMEAIDAFIETRGHANRSEAIRDLARAGLNQAAEAGKGMRETIGAMMYVYDHEARDLPRRLTRSFHEHHDLVLSTLHVHLDHENCMELAALRGPTARVREFAEGVMAERGVKHGRVMLVPGQLTEERHSHGGDPVHVHDHIHPRAHR